MDRAEQTGLGLAVAGHLALLAALSFGLLKPTPLPEIVNEPVEVELIGDSGAAAPVPATEPAAASAPPAEELPPTPAPVPDPVVTPTPQPVKPKPADTADAQRKSREKLAQEKVAKDKAAKANRDKAAAETSAKEKAAKDRAAKDRAAADKAARDKASKDKADAASRTKADADRKAKDKAKRDAASKAEVDRLARAQAAREKVQRDAAAQQAKAGEAAAAKQKARYLLGSIIGPRFQRCAQGGVDANQIFTDIDVYLNPDGSVDDVIVSAQRGINDSNRSQASPLRACALKAARSAGPFTQLPREHADAWRLTKMSLKVK